jgi:hypothetical protein
MTQFEQDLEQDLSVNGKASSKGMWNLIVSKRDLGLWKIGMKPNRHWKVTDVKKYFGLKGNKEKIYEDICKMVEEYTYSMIKPHLKPPTMTKREFLEKYFAPQLTEDEVMHMRLGMMDWEDSFLQECADDAGVTIDFNADRDECDICDDFFDDNGLSYNEATEQAECETCYGTQNQQITS